MDLLSRADEKLLTGMLSVQEGKCLGRKTRSLSLTIFSGDDRGLDGRKELWSGDIKLVVFNVQAILKVRRFDGHLGVRCSERIAQGQKRTPSNPNRCGRVDEPLPLISCLPPKT